MKLKKEILFIILSIFLLSGRTEKVRLFMAGDSTMAEKPLTKTAVDSITGEKSEETFLERGWGMLVPMYLDDDKITVENLAQNGRSTRTFIEQGWWEKITSQLHKGDIVVIQFGHNDGAQNKPDRYTSPEDYRKNLIKMVDEVRAKKATQILCTPIMRRKFDKEGKIVDTHGVYPEIVREVAQQKKVALVDMQKMTTEWLTTEGVENSKKFFHKIPADGSSKLFPKGLDDNTHLNETSAKIVAGMFIQEVKSREIKPLSKYIKKLY